jgi:hypothetical protein
MHHHGDCNHVTDSPWWCQFTGEITHQDNAFDDSVSVVLGINFLQRQEFVNGAVLLHVPATGSTTLAFVAHEAGDERVTSRLETD